MEFDIYGDIQNLPNHHARHCTHTHEAGGEEEERELETASRCLDQVLELVESGNKITLPKNDIFLLRFIRAKKYNADLVYRSLNRYYEARLKFPKSFDKFFPSNYRHVLESGAITLLKHRDSLRRRTFVFRMSKWDPDLLPFEDITMASLLVAEQMSWCPVNQLSGAVILIDESGLGLNHLRQLTLPKVHKLIQLLQDCFPGRYKALHLVNQPYIFDLFCNLAKRFVTKRLVGRIHLHRNSDSLIEMMDPGVLPMSLGGTLEEEDAFDDDFIAKMLAMDGFYADLLTYGFRRKKS